MIDPKSLRIGNTLEYYIEDDPAPYWSETIIDWQDLKWLSERPETFWKVHRPIVLSPSLLERAGFTHRKECPSTTYTIALKSHGLKDLAVVKRHDSNEWIVSMVDNYGTQERTELFPGDISYFHELQNLFYVLKSKELELKLLP